MKNATILFADNDTDFRTTRLEWLQEAGYQVIEASSPVEASVVLDARHVDLAIIDVHLVDDQAIGDESGLRLAERVAAFTPTIIISQFPVNEIRRHFRPMFDGSIAAIDFLAKGDGPLPMMEMVRDILRNPMAGKPNISKQEAVFVTHGHDKAAKIRVENFLLRGGIEPIILQDKPSLGDTIIEKLERYAEGVSFAIILLTPDDMGYSRRRGVSVAKPRARQNVIFEFGFFLARLGRRRVRALYREDVEIPTNVAGVVYISMDGGGDWEKILARELRAAGIGIDLARIMGS